MARSRAEFDPMMSGVRIAVSMWASEDRSQMLTWPQSPVVRTFERGETAPDDEMWLRLPDEAAHAMYEALSQYFGGSSDTLSLRKDYDAERKRVDQFITHLTKG